MAENILKLKVDSSEYDSKIKRASQGIQELGRSLNEAGKSFTDADQKQVDFIKELGNMQTVARGYKARISEMSAAFVDLSAQYKQMTDQEKQSPAGKALAESLAQLKERTLNAKEELANLNKQLEPVNQKTTETGGVMGMLKEKLTVNIDAMKLFSVGLQAAKVALDVAKDAFFNNEQQLDDWGRTVESSESLYKGFLNALNTGDISGFLSNIDQITKAARDAYDALDALNTFNAFNQINVEKTRTGMTESIASYREGTGSREEVKAAGEAYKKELQERKKLEKEAYIEAVGKVAAERGVSKEDLLTALSGTYGSYQQLKNMPMSGQQVVNYGNSMFGGGGSYIKEVPNSVQEKLGDALRRLNDTELQSLQALGAQAERTGNEIASVDKQLTRVLNGRQGGAGGSRNGSGGSRRGSTVKPEEILPVGSVAALSKEIQELQKQQSKVTNTVEWNDYKEKIKAVTNQIKEMKGELGIEALRGMKGVSISGLSKDETTTREDILKKGDQRIRDFKAPTPKDKTEVKLSEEIGKMTSGISSIAGGIESLGVELPQGLQDVLGGIQGVISILTGISTIITAIEAISAADAVIPFANGGIVPHAANGWMVPGNDHSDRTLIAASSGELILNRAQQGVLASQLQDVANGGGYTPSHISGEQIYIALNRYTRRTGKGELVTWR